MNVQHDIMVNAHEAVSRESSVFVSMRATYKTGVELNAHQPKNTYSTAKNATYHARNESGPSAWLKYFFIG